LRGAKPAIGQSEEIVVIFEGIAPSRAIGIGTRLRPQEGSFSGMILAGKCRDLVEMRILSVEVPDHSQ